MQFGVQAGKVLCLALGLGRYFFQLLWHARETLDGLLCILQLRLQLLELRLELRQFPCEDLVLLMVVAHLLLVGRDGRIGFGQLCLQVLQLMLVLAYLALALLPGRFAEML